MGSIPPGMSETVHVSFKADEWTSYEDTVRVQCEGDENLIIKLGAYPSMGKIDFPRQIDFGTCSLTQEYTKQFRLRCDIDMAFDFEIQKIYAASEFKIWPLSGTIPPNGFVAVNVTFVPKSFKVCSCSFRLVVSSSESIVCTVYGNALPGKIRQAEIERHQEEFTRKMEAHPEKKHIERIPFESYGKHAPVHVRGIGAGAVVDPGSVVLLEDEIHFKSEPDILLKNQFIDGLEIPSNLNSMQSTNYLLTQQTGRLKPKAFRKAIEKTRAKREKEKKVEEVRYDPVDKIAADDAFCSDKNVTKQVKEISFLQQMSDIDAEERSREFATQYVFVGPPEMTPDQLNQVEKARKENEKQFRASKRRVQRQNWTNLVIDNNHRIQAPVLAAENCIEPDFNPYRNNLWEMRKNVLQRFRNCISTVLVRCRAQRRLKAIWAKLQGARTVKQVQAIVNEDNRIASFAVVESQPVSQEWVKYKEYLLSKCGRRKLLTADVETVNAIIPDPIQTVASSCLSDVKDLHLVSFPQEDNSALLDAKPVPSTITKGFNDLTLFKLKSAEEFKLCGYEPLPAPIVSRHVPLLTDTDFRTGVNTQSFWRPYKSSSSLPAVLPLHPKLIKPNNEPRLDDFLPDPSFRVFARIESINEFHVQHALRPTVVDISLPQTVDSESRNLMGVCTIRALGLEPTISDRFRTYGNIVHERHTLLEGPLEEDCLSDDEDEPKVLKDDCFISFESAKLLFASSTHEKPGFADENMHRANLDEEIREDRKSRLLALHKEVSRLSNLILSPDLKFNPSVFD